MARPRSATPSTAPAATEPAPAAAPEAPKEKKASTFMLFIWGIPLVVILASVVIRRACMG